MIDFNSEEAKAFRHFHETRTVPLAISVIAGEVVYQLRSTLDHVASVFILRGGKMLTLATQFPIFGFKPAKPGELSRYQKQMNGIDPTSKVWALIEQCQPYNAGHRYNRHALSILKQLNNDDKHRGLALNVVVVNPNVYIRFREMNTGNEVMTGEFE